jgi:hypothetical protein
MAVSQWISKFLKIQVNTHTWQEVALRISQTLLVWNLKGITMTHLASRYYQLDYTCLQELSNTIVVLSCCASFHTCGNIF